MHLHELSRDREAAVIKRTMPDFVVALAVPDKIAASVFEKSADLKIEI